MFLKFETINNIRDIGGIKTIDGRVIKSGTFLRSGDLHNLSKEEFNILKEKYNLKTVVDLRSTKSFFKKKDVIDKTINYRHTICLHELDEISYSIDLTDPDAFMKHVYESLASYPEAALAYKLFFKWLLKFDEGTFLVHCTSGKDRTGIATALLMYILGCSKKDIYEEYLRTNEFNKPRLDKILSKIPNISKHDYEYYYYFYIVKEEYLDIYFNTLVAKFGSIDNFICRKLELKQEDLESIRKRFLLEV